MDVFALFLTEAYNIMTIPFEIFGFQLSFFQVFAYTSVAGVLLWMVWEIFDG